MKARLPQQYQPKSQAEMLRQAQKMQSDMQSFQEELQEKEFTTEAGGGMVKCTMLGKKEITSLTIDPEIIDPDDAEMLGDLIAAAVNSCIQKIDVYTEENMSQFTGGLSIPGLF